MNFSAVTYNVLAQAYVKPERYIGVAPEALDAARRRALLLSRIRDFHADVTCLQEVEPDLFDALVQALPEHRGLYGQQLRLWDRSPVLDTEVAAWIHLAQASLAHHDGHLPEADRRLELAALGARRAGAAAVAELGLFQARRASDAGIRRGQCRSGR